MAIAWTILTLLCLLPAPFRAIAHFAVIFLLPVQKTANNINDIFAPEHDKNNKFTGWNIFGIVVGLLFYLGLAGASIPTE